MKVFKKTDATLATAQRQAAMVNDGYRIYVYDSVQETKAFNLVSSSSTGAPLPIGFCAHLGMNVATYTAAQVLGAIQTLNGAIWRDEAKWSYTEASRGSLAFPGVNSYLSRVNDALNAAASYGVTPQLILNYGNAAYGSNVPTGYQGGLVLDADEKAGYSAYCSYIVSQIGSRCNLWEVWNEWNISNGGTTQEVADTAGLSVTAYLDVLQIAYAAAKAANPSVKIVGGVVAEPYDQTARSEDWFNTFLATNWHQYCDEFSFHHYHNFCIPERWHDQLQDTITKVRAVAPTKPIRITETGWYNGTGVRAITEAESAARYSRYPFLLRCLDLVGVSFYDLANDGTDPAQDEHNFGFYTQNLGAQKAQAATITAAMAHIKVATSGSHYTDLSMKRRVVVMDTNTANGQRAACWAIDATGTTTLTVTASAPGTLSIQTIGGSTATQAIVVGANTVNVTLSNTAKVVFANVQISITV
jgi:hypothetical protein